MKTMKTTTAFFCLLILINGGCAANLPKRVNRFKGLGIRLVTDTTTSMSNKIPQYTLQKWLEAMEIINSMCPRYQKFFITQTKELRKKNKFTFDMNSIKKAQSDSTKNFHAVSWVTLEMGLHHGKNFIRYKYKKCVGKVEYQCYRENGQVDAYVSIFAPKYLRTTGDCRSKALRTLCGDFKHSHPTCIDWRKRCVKGLTFYRCNRFEAVCRKYTKKTSEVSIPGFMHQLKRPEKYHQWCEIPARGYLRARNEAEFDHTKGKWYYPALKFPQIVKKMAMFLYRLRIQPNTATTKSSADGISDDLDDDWSSDSTDPSNSYAQSVDQFKHTSHWQEKYVELFKKRVYFPSACGIVQRNDINKSLKFYRKVHRHVLLAAIAYTHMQYLIFRAWYSHEYPDQKELATQMRKYRLFKVVHQHLQKAHQLLYRKDSSKKTTKYINAIQALGGKLKGKTYTVTIKIKKDGKIQKKQKVLQCSRTTQAVRAAWQKTASALEQISQNYKHQQAFLVEKSQPEARKTPARPTSRPTVRTGRKKKMQQKPTKKFRKLPDYVLEFLKRK